MPNSKNLACGRMIIECILVVKYTKNKLMKSYYNVIERLITAVFDGVTWGLLG